MENNLTVGSPIKKILWFTLPIFIGNVFQLLYNFADAIIVGRLLGVNELAAVGATGSLMFVALGFMQGCGTGFSIIISQHFGRGDHKKVKEAFATSIVLSTIIAIIITIISFLLVRPLLVFMNTPAEILEFSYDYLSVIFLGSGAVVAFNLLSNTLRALGNSLTPLIFLIIASVVHIFLGWFFIAVIPLGVTGAALSTVISEVISSLGCVWYIRKKFPALQIKREDFTLEKKEINRQLSLGVPMGFQSSIIALGSVTVQYVLNGFGTVAIAAYTSAAKIEFFSTMPVSSLGTALATFAGQNFGAKKFDRIRKTFSILLISSVIFSIFMGLVNILFGDHLIGVFVSQKETQVIELGKLVLTVNGLFYWALAILFICRFTLQGLGKSFVPTFSGVMELISRLLAALIFAQHFGFIGVTFANPLAWILAAIPLFVSCLRTLKYLEEDSLSSF